MANRMHSGPPPGLFRTGNLAGERIQTTHGSLCKVQQGSMVDVTEHVHGTFHLSQRSRRPTGKNAKSHHMFSCVGSLYPLLPILMTEQDNLQKSYTRMP